ncbi:MAG: TRAP transporter substrate-binding protein [Syntrophobacterales bacterium]|nr:TRAP transporter substrate-binding protein [Syntrophobacterales bacterium]
MKNIFALMAAALLLFTGCGAPPDKSPKGEAKMPLRLASVTAASHTYNLGAMRFAELVKERTKGRIEITVYPEGQLGKGEWELLEAVRQGTVDIYVGSTGPLSGFSPSMAILDIPFLFRDHAHADKVLDGELGRQLLDELDKVGFKALAFWENGFRNLTNSRRPVKNPADARGLKIRTMENQIHIAAWKTLGVNPVPMAWGEVYGALRQQVIDGQENPIAVIFSSKLNEVQKYLSLTQHVYSPALIIVSAKKWQTLTKEDQDILLNAARETASFQRKLGRENEEKQIGELAAKGMIVTRDIDKARWSKALKPVIKEYHAAFGKDRIESIANVQ